MAFLDELNYVTMVSHLLPLALMILTTIPQYSVFVASSPTLMNGHFGTGQVGTGSSLFNDDGSLSANGVAYRG